MAAQHEPPGRSQGEYRSAHSVSAPLHAPRKLKVATVSLAGCFGCHMSFLDIDNRLFESIEHIEFDRSPFTDIKEVGVCDIGLIEGGLCNADNVRVLREFRARCKTLVAVGACAITGGLPAQRNHLLWLGLLLRSEGVAAAREAAALLQTGVRLPEPIMRIPWLGPWLQERLLELSGDRAAWGRQLAELGEQLGGRAMRLVGDIGLNALRFGVSLLTAFFLFRDGERLLDQLRHILRGLLGDRVQLADLIDSNGRKVGSGYLEMTGYAGRLSL